MKSLKRIAIIGPESTGKSTLSNALADHYQTESVPEFARTYIDDLDRPYEMADLIKISKGQLAIEDKNAMRARQYLFCDTNLIIIKVWSDHKYGQTDPWIEQQLKSRFYDFYLLTDIDLPWAFDPQREHPDLRAHFFGIFKAFLDQHKLPYAIVRGLGHQRTRAAISALESHFRTN